MKHRIFFRKDFKFPGEFRLEKEETDHLKSLRIFDKDKILDFRDGAGNSALYSVFSGKREAILQQKNEKKAAEPEIIIATAIPKGNRYDWLLQKGTELGITAFLFVNFRRSERKELNFERSEKIISEAGGQSGRYYLPKIRLFDSLEKMIAAEAETPEKFLLLSPIAEEKLDTEKISSTIPIIGPEGGFDPEELKMFEKLKIGTANAGDSILRIETAVLFMASIKRLHFI